MCKLKDIHGQATLRVGNSYFMATEPVGTHSTAKLLTTGLFHMVRVAVWSMSPYSTKCMMSASTSSAHPVPSTASLWASCRWQL